MGLLRAAVTPYGEPQATVAIAGAKRVARPGLTSAVDLVDGYEAADALFGEGAVSRGQGR